MTNPQPFSPETSKTGKEQLEDDAKRRRRAIAGVSAGLALAIVGVTVGLYLTRTPTVPSPLPPQPPCPQCMDPKPTSPAMKAVLDDITAENKLATHGKQWVSIVLLTPLASSAGSDVTVTRMVDELRGAYDAQRGMNATGTIPVQLLVDNEGSSAEEQEGAAIRQLEYVTPADHVVAVVGMGVSNSQTAAAGSALDAFGMPMIATVASADQFSAAGQFPDMAQVVSDVSTQVKELIAKIGQPASAILVHDSTTTDYYTGDLDNDFTNGFTASIGGSQPQPYTPNENDNAQFRTTAMDVCDPQSTPVVLYAGRQIVLSAFITQLMAYNGCDHKKITIVTAADADGLSPSSTKNLAGEGQVSVVYTDIVDLGQLSPGFGTTYGKILGSADPGASGLTDTWLAMTYNGMEAAYTAIENAYGAGGNIPTKDTVLPAIRQLNTAISVPGATGNFTLTEDGQPISPTIPIFADVNGYRHPFSPAIAAELGLQEALLR